jgi:tetratricopeptide (TPR) repeat protein
MQAAREKAEREEEAGRWREAAELWAEIVQEEDDPVALSRYARALAFGGRPADAEVVLRDAIRRFPSFARAYFQLGILLKQMGRLKEAQSMLEEGLAREECQPILTILGAVERHTGATTAAEVSLRRSLELDATDDEAHFHLGLTLRDSDPHEAIRHFQGALRLDPALPEAERELGHALWRAGLHDEAEAAFGRAIEADPKDAWAHAYLGHLLGQKRLWGPAKHEFSLAADLEPRIGYFFCCAADACAYSGDHDEADRLFRHALSLGTDEPYVNLRYGLFLKRAGKIGRAKTYLKRALRLDPGEKRALDALNSMGHS